MRRMFLAVACGVMMIGQASAMPVGIAAQEARPGALLVVQPGARDFSRCMRKRYGPHYYRGVKRAHRYFMAQACGW